MLIGDIVIYEGRRYVVVGVTPFSVTPFKVLLEDAATKDRFWREWPPADAVERAASRVVSDESEG
jgi:hypothetical protein